MTPLTTEQEAEFTVFNFLVFDLNRKESIAYPPCWLCMSKKAKQEAKERFAAWLSSINQVPSLTVEDAEEIVNRRMANVIKESVKLWKTAELEFKRLREDENNPRAFSTSLFCRIDTR